MARKKGELPSGNVRRQVYLGKEPVYDDQGRPVIDPKTGKQKQRRVYSSITSSSAREADAIAAARKNRRRNPSNMTFEEARTAYIESKRNVLSPSTVRGYLTMCKSWFLPLDYRRLGDIDSKVVQEYVNQFAISHSPKSVRNAYGFVRVVLEANDVHVKVTLPQKEIKTLHTPTDADVQRVIRHFQERGDSPMVLAIYLAAFATLRRSEICGLTAEDIDRENCLIHVHASLLDAADGGQVYRNKVKNSSSDRYINVPQFIIDLCPTEGRVVPIAPSTLTTKFIDAVKDCGVSHFRFHDLRHYSASIMHAIGVPDVYIMDRGGWNSDNTLKRIYRGQLDDYKKTFVQQTNDYFENLIQKSDEPAEP